MVCSRAPSTATSSPRDTCPTTPSSGKRCTVTATTSPATRWSPDPGPSLTTRTSLAGCGPANRFG
eukprot:377619-Pyramimonas_sp.AAC.2